MHIPALYRFNNNRYKIRGFCVYREIQRHFKHGPTPPPQCHQGFIAVSFKHISELRHRNILKLISCDYYIFLKGKSGFLYYWQAKKYPRFSILLMSFFNFSQKLAISFQYSWYLCGSELNIEIFQTLQQQSIK